VLCFEGMVLSSITVLAAVACCLFLTPADAQTIKMCAGAEVRAMELSTDNDITVARRDAPSAAIEVLPASIPATATEVVPVTVIALGPALSSMDSRKVETEVTCTDKGLVLTATITHDDGVLGYFLPQNILWHPRFKIVIMLHQPQVIFQMIWKMRLPTGTELNHTQTPSYPEQKYPIAMTATLRSAPSRTP
jgi:hypothetical protein